MLPGGLEEIGVKPMIDEATGEMVVSADAFAAALGMSEAEVRDNIGGARAIRSIGSGLSSDPSPAEAASSPPSRPRKFRLGGIGSGSSGKSNAPDRRPDRV
jgi:hypothetical protein